MSDQNRESSQEQSLAGLITLPDAAGRTGVSHSHLRLLVREKKVWAVKVGRDWLTTESAVREYLATNPRPGPKKKQ